jgi:hypothetical protein
MMLNNKSLFSEGTGQRRLACLAGLIGTVLIMMSMAACSPQPEEISIELGQEFSLMPNQSGSIESESLELRFREVINDSRCPKGVTCVWEGEVSCLVDITYMSSTSGIVLTQRGSGQSVTSFKDYYISFQVQPYPEAGKDIDKEDYRLELTIDKQPILSGGVLATFDVLGENYSIFITNKETIEQVLVLQRGESAATIPSGRLLRGSVTYNEPWSWHIDSEDVHMAEITIELCDGLPSQVEANMDYWVNTVQRFCPWQAQLVGVRDFR